MSKWLEPHKPHIAKKEKEKKSVNSDTGLLLRSVWGIYSLHLGL